MDSLLKKITTTLAIWLGLTCITSLHVAKADERLIEFPRVNRPWGGKHLWLNPLEDWQVKDGHLENVESGGNRNAVVLDAEIAPRGGSFSLKTTITQRSPQFAPKGFVGIALGLQGKFDDYRDTAIHGLGFYVGITARGALFIGNPRENDPLISLPLEKIELEVIGQSNGPGYSLEIVAKDASGKEIARNKREGIDGSWLPGMVGVVASTTLPPPVILRELRPTHAAPLPQARGGEARFAFGAIKLSGDRIDLFDDRSFGPILWTTHTLTNQGDLRLLVQMAPVDFDNARVEVLLDGAVTMSSPVDRDSRTAEVLFPKVDTQTGHSYSVRFTDSDGSQNEFSGKIAAIPVDRPVVVASLSCNDATGFPHNRLVTNVAAHKPDMITFHGDQIYEAIGGYGLVMGGSDRSLLSYLRKYYMHGWCWREILRDIPSVTIPDDHDVFHGNLWGNGGKQADISLPQVFQQQDSGGYKQPPSFVNAVHKTQTGNLPPPADPAPCESGISVYFTAFQYGSLDFVVLADRQFKSAPQALLPEGKIVNGWPQNIEWDAKTLAEHPDAELLGKRQEEFLKQWSQSASKESPFRIAISQSPWCAPQTLPEDVHNDSAVPKLPVYPIDQYAPNDEPKADFDTNGWPQSKRDYALTLLQQAGAIHITGDQHLGSTGRYGISQWNDGPVWVSTPATANTWPRRWMPKNPGNNPLPHAPKYTGEFIDGFGNKMTILAIANPHDIDREPARLFDRAVGYTITKFDPASQAIEIANWPYWCSPTKNEPDNQPYPGWPISIPAPTLKFEASSGERP